MKEATARCPGVLDQIAEVEALDAAGDCWCQCVKDDIPKAKDLAARGLCLGAAKVIKAARARCTSTAEKLQSGIALPIDFKPVKPLSLSEMMAPAARSES